MSSDPVKFTIINIGTLSLNKFWGETERRRSPSATCTLLEAGGRRLLVDPSPHPDRLEPLLFANAGLRPGDVDLVFVTHYHGDHRYGLDLFAGKPWLMAAAGLEEWRRAAPAERAIWDRFMPAEDVLLAGMTLLHTPGHTLAHHSLSVETEWGRLFVAGDAVMTRDFFKAAQGFHNSADPVEAVETIHAIKRVADLVVPGHGNYFLNPR